MNFLLKKKRHLLSSRIFSILVGLTGSSDQEFQDIKIEKGKQQIIQISSLNKSFNRSLFEEIICDLNLWLHCKNIDNNNNQLLGNVLRHISEFFQKCVDLKLTGESAEKDVCIIEIYVSPGQLSFLTAGETIKNGFHSEVFDGSQSDGKDYRSANAIQYQSSESCHSRPSV